MDLKDCIQEVELNCKNPCILDIIYGQARIYRKIKEFHNESMALAIENKNEIICDGKYNTDKIICDADKNKEQILYKLEKILVNTEKSRKYAWGARIIAKKNQKKLCRIEKLLSDILRCL